MGLGEKLNLVEIERIHKDKERLEELKMRTKKLLLPVLRRKLGLRRIFVWDGQQRPGGNFLR